MTIRSRILSDRLNDKELEQFCLEQKELRIERAADGTIFIMSPTYSLTGKNNSEILIQLGIWNKREKHGHVFDSSSGFYLPNGAMRSPDVSFISHERWRALSVADREGFARICPEFVVELKSHTDTLSDLQKKMSEWRANGCQLGWLIDVATETVYVYRADGGDETREGFDRNLSGEAILPGFELELNELRP
ncbi:MAG: Uma2 family endonuclease [Cytophagaceae bacterium]|nr:Uma2 family endonuclease [Cytophagaceae bacterium]